MILSTDHERIGIPYLVSMLAFFGVIMISLVAIPSGVKVFNWVATLYKGSIDIHVHGTHFVVGHFHYTMFGGTLMFIAFDIHYFTMDLPLAMLGIPLQATTLGAAKKVLLSRGASE